MSYLFTIPLILVLLAAPFMKPEQSLKYYLGALPIAEPYIAAGVTVALHGIWYFKFLLPGVQVSRFKISKGALGFILIFLTYSCLSAIWTNYFSRFLSEIIQLVILMTQLFFIMTYIDSFKKLQLLLTGYCVGGILTSFKTFTQSITGSLIADNYHALYIMFGCIAIPAAAFFYVPKIMRPVLVGIIILGFAGITLHEARASTLMGIASILLAFYAYLRRNKIVRVLTLFVLACAIPLTVLYLYKSAEENIVHSVTDTERNFSNLERLALAQQSIDLFLAKPIGHGYGSSSEIFPQSTYTIGSYPQPHNTLFHLIVELGLVGLLLYIMLVTLILSVSVAASKLENIPATQSSQESRAFKTTRTFCMIMGPLLFIAFIPDDIFFSGIYSLIIISFIGTMFAFKKILQSAPSHKLS